MPYGQIDYKEKHRIMLRNFFNVAISLTAYDLTCNSHYDSDYMIEIEIHEKKETMYSYFEDLVDMDYYFDILQLNFSNNIIL
jgi:hypothetical protein